MKEIEAKFKLLDLSIISEMELLEIKKVKVLDIYLDNDFLKLKSQDKVLRLRKENDKFYIAFKGPREKHHTLVIREEIEPEISSFNDGLKLLRNLNFYEVAKIEKIRQYFTSKKLPSLSITIDTYPFIGSYIEIEGEENKIHLFCKKYRLDIKNSVLKNCTEIFLQYCEEKNLPFKEPGLHFTFFDEKSFQS